MYIKTHGLVLREVAYKESDKILSLLTKDHGKITATARGCRKKNSPLTAPCQQLIWSELILFEYRGKFTIQEISMEKDFRNIQKNINSFSLACYFAEICETIAVENTPQESLLSLILNSLFLLNEGKLPLPQIKAVFELRAACESGYEPLLDSCSFCQNPNPKQTQLSPLDGSIHCRSCGGKALPISPSVLAAMRFITQSHPKNIFSFSFQNPNELESVTQHYLISQLDAHFKTLNFYQKYQ